MLLAKADTESLNTAKKEKLQVGHDHRMKRFKQLCFQERVDDWMSDLCKNMNLKESASKVNKSHRSLDKPSYFGNRRRKRVLAHGYA